MAAYQYVYVMKNLSKVYPGGREILKGVTLAFLPDAIAEVAPVAFVANDRMENIGARRLHTVMATLMEDLLFDLPDYPEKRIVFDGEAVKARLARIVNDDDLRRYIL